MIGLCAKRPYALEAHSLIKIDRSAIGGVIGHQKIRSARVHHDFVNSRIGLRMPMDDDKLHPWTA
jgi:hypothetical protein